MLCIKKRDERTDGRTDGRTNNPEAICPSNFFEVGCIKMPNSPGAYAFYEKITGNSVAEPSIISLFSIGQPMPQVIQTRSYTFTKYLLGEKTAKRL